jgi:hypothetical protein
LLSTDDHAIREVLLKLSDSLEPVGLGLLGDELDVEEGALAGTEAVSAGGAAHNTRGDVGDEVLDEREGLGDSEAPASLKRAADHVGRRARGGRRQTEWVGEPNAGHLDRDVDFVNWRVELWQLRLLWHTESVKRLHILVHVPRRRLAVVGRLH